MVKCCDSQDSGSTSSRGKDLFALSRGLTLCVLELSKLLAQPRFNSSAVPHNFSQDLSYMHFERNFSDGREGLTVSSIIFPLTIRPYDGTQMYIYLYSFTDRFTTLYST